MAVNIYLSRITSNVFGRNALNKRHGVAEWIRYAAYKGLTLEQGTHRLKVRGWKKIFQANGNQKKVGIPIFVSEK